MRSGGDATAGRVVSRGEIRRELIELEFPEAAIALDPRRCIAHWRGHERRTADAPLALDARKPGALEDANVLGNGRERHVEARREIADGALSGCQPRNDCAARGVGEGGEGGVEARLEVNHMV